LKVIRSDVLGFCMGVRRAVDMAVEAAGSCSRVYSIGPVIHNPEVLAALESKGVVSVNELELPENLENCSVIIRAHGISPKTENKLRNMGCKIIDATCPRVKASQLKARELADSGFLLFLAGEAGHAEIKGILGYARDGFCVTAECAAEAQKEAARLYKTRGSVKTALLGQTTISEDEYSAVSKAIKEYFPDLKIINTICAATADRQKSLRELLNYAEAVVIAGGRESANTRRLLLIAQESGKPCVLAENAGEIPNNFKKFETVGLCSGASTPDSVIDDIERELIS
jgi:4-hydroxy-3-methylbut-2-en-1-yl diphosphate reductase